MCDEASKNITIILLISFSSRSLLMRLLPSATLHQWGWLLTSSLGKWSINIVLHKEELFFLAHQWISNHFFFSFFFFCFSFSYEAKALKGQSSSHIKIDWLATRKRHSHRIYLVVTKSFQMLGLSAFACICMQEHLSGIIDVNKTTWNAWRQQNFELEGITITSAFRSQFFLDILK